MLGIITVCQKSRLNLSFQMACFSLSLPLLIIAPEDFSLAKFCHMELSCLFSHTRSDLNKFLLHSYIKKSTWQSPTQACHPHQRGGGGDIPHLRKSRRGLVVVGMPSAGQLRK